MSDAVVLYHKNCLDGFGAAYAAWLHFGDKAEYFPAQYGTPSLPEEMSLADKDVYMVDFSASPEDVIEMSREAKSITIIDHHESAVRKLQDHPTLASDVSCPLRLVFDMKESGAVMTWRFFHVEETVPEFLLYIQDRDLWQFKYPETKPFTEVMYNVVPFDFDEWHDVFVHGDTAALVATGTALLNKQITSVETIQKDAAHKLILGHIVPCVNANAMFSSDIGNNLSIDAPFAATFTVALEEKEARFSLRSSKDNPDYVNVAEVAEMFGGGGHRHAAGFAVPLGENFFKWLLNETALWPKEKS